MIDLGDGARATCVGRYGEFIDGSSGGTSSNNLSVSLLIEYGGFDYVTAGDLETNENQLSTALIGYPPADPVSDSDPDAHPVRDTDAGRVPYPESDAQYHTDSQYHPDPAAHPDAGAGRLPLL